MLRVSVHNLRLKVKSLKSDHPKVFISYSHDSTVHSDRVWDLCERLRQNGVDCRIDQHEASPSDGWTRWCRNQVQQADFVLVVCTQTYEQRYEGKEETGKGKGGTWEGFIISQQLYEAAGKNTKFIPVVFCADDLAYIPLEFKSATPYDLSSGARYDSLYYRLTNQPEKVKSPVGTIQPMQPLKRQQPLTQESASLEPNQASESLSYDTKTETPGKVAERVRVKVGSRNMLTKENITILHISDLHAGERQSEFFNNLSARLRSITDFLKATQDKPDIVICSGDLADAGGWLEYKGIIDHIRIFCHDLRKYVNREFDVRRFVVAPGNHDISWPLSTGSYGTWETAKQGQENIFIKTPVERAPNAEIPTPGHGARFAPFLRFWDALYGVGNVPWHFEDLYPAYALFDFPEFFLKVISFNTCWTTDQINQEGAFPFIKSTAAAPFEKYLQSQLSPEVATGYTHIAVGHHNVIGIDEQYLPPMKNHVACLQLLRRLGINIYLSGHVHNAYYRYEQDYKVHCFSVGSFSSLDSLRSQILNFYSAPMLFEMFSIPVSGGTCKAMGYMYDKSGGMPEWVAFPKMYPREKGQRMPSISFRIEKQKMPKASQIAKKHVFEEFPTTGPVSLSDYHILLTDHLEHTQYCLQTINDWPPEEWITKIEHMWDYIEALKRLITGRHARVERITMYDKDPSLGEELSAKSQQEVKAFFEKLLGHEIPLREGRHLRMDLLVWFLSMHKTLDAAVWLTKSCRNTPEEEWFIYDKEWVLFAKYGESKEQVFLSMKRNENNKYTIDWERKFHAAYDKRSVFSWKIYDLVHQGAYKIPEYLISLLPSKALPAFLQP